MCIVILALHFQKLFWTGYVKRRRWGRVFWLDKLGRDVSFFSCHVLIIFMVIWCSTSCVLLTQKTRKRAEDWQYGGKYICLFCQKFYISVFFEPSTIWLLWNMVCVMYVGTLYQRSVVKIFCSLRYGVVFNNRSSSFGAHLIWKLFSLETVSNWEDFGSVSFYTKGKKLVSIGI